MAYQYLFDPNKQFQNVAGTNNVAGFLRVFYNGTDDMAVTYKDFNGTANPADIPVDNNGRAVVIVNEDMVYRLEVYNRDGALLWSQYPLSAKTIPAAQVQSDWDATSGVAEILNKPNLARVATSGSYDDLDNKPNLSIYAESSSLATVATSGDYGDLSNKPTIPAAQVQSDWSQSNPSSVDFIKNKPNIGSDSTKIYSSTYEPTYDDFGSYDAFVKSVNNDRVSLDLTIDNMRIGKVYTLLSPKTYNFIRLKTESIESCTWYWANQTGTITTSYEKPSFVTNGLGMMMVCRVSTNEIVITGY